MPFLKLPRDVIDEILYELPVTDMLTCLGVNKYLNEILSDSIRLKLKLQLGRLGAESNPFVRISPFERLQILNESTQNWNSLTPEFTCFVNIPFGSSHLQIHEGVALAENADGTTIEFTVLPRTQKEANSNRQVWYPINLGVRRLIKCCLRWFEHDLLVVVGSTMDFTGVNAAPQFTITMQFNTFSTQAPHPDASVPLLFVMKSPIQKPLASINVLGRYLVLVIRVFVPGEHNATFVSCNRVILYDWKAATILMQFISPLQYEEATFLSEDFIVLPNAPKGRIDIFHIPKAPLDGVPAPCISLGLPELVPDLQYISITMQCSNDPISEESWTGIYQRHTSFSGQNSHKSIPTDWNILPTGAHVKLDTFPQHKPFRMRGEDAVFIFNISVGGFIIVAGPNGTHARQLVVVEKFAMMVHRKALVAATEEYVPVPRPRGRSNWPSFIDEHVRPVPPCVNMPSPAITVSWAQWGPAVTRWLFHGIRQPGLSHHLPVIAQVFGERCVGLPHFDGTHRVPYQLLEFNPYLCWNTALRHITPNSDSVDSGRDSRHCSDMAKEGSTDDHRDLVNNSDTMDTDSSAGSPSTVNTPDSQPTGGPSSTSTSTPPPPLMCACIEVSSELSAAEWRRKIVSNTLPSRSFMHPLESELPYLSASSQGTGAGLVNWIHVWADEERVVGLVHFKEGDRSMVRFEIHHFGYAKSGAGAE